MSQHANGQSQSEVWGKEFPKLHKTWRDEQPESKVLVDREVGGFGKIHT